MKRVLLGAFLLPLRAYRRFLSPGLPRRCRYHPTCSAYAEEAIRELGIARGALVAAWRLLRCNPFSRGGYDPLEARTLFRACGRSAPTDGRRPPSGNECEVGAHIGPGSHIRSESDGTGAPGTASAAPSPSRRAPAPPARRAPSTRGATA